MMSFTSLFDSFAHAAAPIAVTGLWQGLAIALALALCLRVTRRVSAGQRFVLWSVGFLAAGVLPLSPLVFSHSSSHSAGPFSAPAAHAWLQLDARWSLMLAALWLIASSVRAVDLIFHVIRLWRLWRTATPVDIATPLRHKRSCKVYSTQSLDRPSVIGFFAPRVLIPDWLLPRLTPDELNQIVLHEATHLARYDDWTNLLQTLCITIFPLNPALWAMDGQLAKEREMACDETVVRITKAPRAYAACLARLAERGMAHHRETLSLGAWRRRPELVSRIHRILRGHPSLPPAAGRVLLATFGCSLIVVTLELARCPQLVAFVPTTQAGPIVSVQNSLAELGDAVYPTNPKSAVLIPGAQMVRAKAEIPTASIAKPLAGRVKVRAGGELRSGASQRGAGLQVLEARQEIRSHVHSEASHQVIVFTAWEQIETDPPASRTTVADYDTQPTTGASSTGQQATADAAKDRAERSASKAARDLAQHHSTVTQLILRVVPGNSDSMQPIAFPMSWFVIQL